MPTCVLFSETWLSFKIFCPMGTIKFIFCHWTKNCYPCHPAPTHQSPGPLSFIGWVELTVIFILAERMILATAASTLLVLLCLTTQSTAQVDCSNITGLINAGDCSFYDCLNTRFQCGPTDYPLAYGKRYCLRFATQSSCFTEEVSQQHSHQ